MDAMLIVDDEFTRHRVQHLNGCGDRNLAAVVQDMQNVFPGDLARLGHDRHHSARGRAFDVAAVDAYIEIVDFAAEFAFDLGDGCGNRFSGGVDVRYDALFNPVARGSSHRDDADPIAGGRLGDQTGHLCRPHI